MKDYEAICAAHKYFWEMKGQNRPFIIFCLDWVNGPKLIDSVPNLISGRISPSDIHAEDFLPMHEKLCLEDEALCDDKLGMVEPLCALPWMEAFFGCGVVRNGHHMWTQKVISSVDEIESAIEKGPDFAWQRCYFDYINSLSEAFSGRWAVAQPILRGITDVACAMMGEEALVYAMYDEPDLIRSFLEYICDRQRAFYQEQMRRIPAFHDGYAVGQYHIWSP